MASTFKLGGCKDRFSQLISFGLPGGDNLEICAIFEVEFGMKLPGLSQQVGPMNSNIYLSPLSQLVFCVCGTAWQKLPADQEVCFSPLTYFQQ